MVEAQQQQKSWYDKSARQRSFEPGQRVLVLLPSDNNKLLVKWQGPFEVMRKLGPTTYEVSTPGQLRSSKVLHINLLKENGNICFNMSSKNGMKVKIKFQCAEYPAANISLHSESKSWIDALEDCQTEHFSLVEICEKKLNRTSSANFDFDNHCGKVIFDNKTEEIKWSNANCHEKLPYICQRMNEKPCTDDYTEKSELFIDID
ncbi:unnamed protein product [Oreochromis niloticus]|nr:unnamed protein product [Mustela putorius furo]